MIRIKKEIKMEKDSATNNYKEDNDEPTSISHLSTPMPSTKDGETTTKAATTPQIPETKNNSFLSILAPGLITRASDDDPSDIATYSQAGAWFGFVMLWMVLFLYPLMAAVQEICARIGLVTGNGLAGIIKKKYSRK